MPNTLRPPVKLIGGKRYCKDFIISNFPPNYPALDYYEPFAGGASVLLNKRRSHRETLNDLDRGIYCIHKAIRDTPNKFISLLKETIYAEDFFEATKNKVTNSDIETAVKDFVLRRMSRVGLKSDFSSSSRQRGGRPGDENAYWTMIDHLPWLALRLQGVEITNENAFEVIKEKGKAGTFFYLDPPYLPQTRRTLKTYGCDLTTEQHVELAEILNKSKAQIALSGYPAPLYDELYAGWRCETMKIVNHSSQKKKKEYKVECLWMNY